MNSCAPAVSEFASRARRPRILVVEDEALVARDLQQLLRGLGYDACATAASSGEALAQARSSLPDIVLMDIRLKGSKDGIETAKILQKELGPAIIYLTAHSDEVTLQRAKHTGPYGYLLKPVNEAALRSLVEITLYRREIDRARDEAALLSASLQQSEERFRQLAENIQDVFFIVAADYSKLIYQSPAFEQIWGRPYDPSNSMDWTTSIHVDDYQRIMDQIAGQAGKPVIDEFEFRIVQPSGAVRWIFARHFPLCDATGSPYRIVGVATDITERKLAEENIRQLNRVYAVLSGINALIIRAQTQSELFTGSCRLAVEQGDFTLAWIGWLEDGGALLKPIAWAGSDVVAGLLKENDAVDIGDDAVATIGRREAWVCNDLDSMRPLFPYQRALLNHGLRSAVTLPLVMHGKTMGCLVLATDERDFYNDVEMRLLTELAGDISFALDHIEKTEKLNYLAYFDVLTGLANRSLFLERLAQQVYAAKHNHTQFAVVVRDPDRFQSINETFGRVQGDEILREVAARLVRSTGHANGNARIGSDQFASVLPFSGDVEAVARVLEDQYRLWLGEPFRVRGHDVLLTACTGVAIYPHDGDDAEILLKHAEAALKRASAQGEHTVFFTQEISDRITERLSMETRMRRALENGEFELHYQPKVDTETRRWDGLEALIRWRNPELGLVLPSKFIPLMEETGMIIEVGAWVMLQACMDRIGWLEQGLAAPRIAVNISPVQLHRADFFETVRTALKQATRNALLFGAHEAGLDVEVTESLFVNHVESNIEKLRALRALGVGIAIDDFGTGYSCLGYLAKMPLSALKIDRTFTAAMLDDPSVTTLVSTIITLAHSLKLKVVAEGVESEEQAKILRLLRCDQMQGYLISQPLTAAEIVPFLLPSA